jgi:excisionase family DNA binding protein
VDPDLERRIEEFQTCMTRCMELLGEILAATASRPAPARRLRYSTRQAAEELGVCENTVRELRRQGKLSAYTEGRRVFYSAQALEEYQNRCLLVEQAQAELLRRQNQEPETLRKGRPRRIPAERTIGAGETERTRR